MTNAGKECAFCGHTGKLSLEHTVSRWIADLFPGKKFTSWRISNKETKRFVRDSIDWKARVVCEPCNNTWMSDIEAKAQPVLTPLITGETGLIIDTQAAHAIAMFAFNKAVVVDHASRTTAPFFSRRSRHNFREHGIIAPDVNIWICGFMNHRGSGQVRTEYLKGKSPLGNHFHMYAYTFAYGLFACQVLGVKQIGKAQFGSRSGFEGLAARIWPDLPTLAWPGPYALADRKMFIDFSARWNPVDIIE